MTNKPIASFNIFPHYKRRFFFWQRRKERERILSYVSQCPIIRCHVIGVSVATSWGHVYINAGPGWRVDGMPFHPRWDERFNLWVEVSKRQDVTERILKALREKDGE